MREYLRVSRVGEGTEGRLAAKQSLLAGRLFIRIRIVPGGLGYRRRRQSIAFGVPIDRDGDARRTIDRARQHANCASDQTAQSGSCHYTLEPLAIYETHGTSPTF